MAKTEMKKMEKLKSSFTNMALVLTLVAVVAGALLAWVNHITEKPIQEQAKRTLDEAIKQVMNVENLSVNSVDTVVKQYNGDQYKYVVYHAKGVDGNSLGAAVESIVTGFGGELKVLVGFDDNGTLLGYRVLQSAETPGLGQKADAWFQKGAKGCVVGRKMSLSSPLTVKNDGGDVDAITASTITSRAFLKAVNRAFEAFEQNIDDSSHADGHTGASQKTENGKSNADAHTGASQKTNRNNGKQN